MAKFLRQLQQCDPCKPAFKFNQKVQSFAFFIGGSGGESLQGLTRTEANYNSAIEILQKRFGKPQNIISKHMDEMLKIPSCVRDNASQLRLVCDKISVNVRGLESLAVSSTQYGSPCVLQGRSCFSLL